MESESLPYSIEESIDRLKISIPVKINWVLLLLFTLALAVWLGMILVVAIYLIRGMSSSFVLTAILLIWMLVWLWFGRFLWSRWQYQAATREILFVDEEQVIVRRPLSILGSTKSYDRHHLSPFYFSDRNQSAAFDYAYLHVYFGKSLSQESAGLLIDNLNARIFPETADIDQ
jgi:hypothetical protein